MDAKPSRAKQRAKVLERQRSQDKARREGKSESAQKDRLA